MPKFGLEEKIIVELINIFKKYKEVENVRIFGSRARGDNREASDIDIALFGDNLTNAINTQIFYDIDDLYLPYQIDLINFNSLSTEDKLRENILKEGVEIYVK